MPDVLDQDEELMRQEEQDRLLEEERQRLLEEALAQQQDFIEPPPIPQGGNYFNQPQREIDALQARFNAQAQPTAFAPAVRESYTPDSAQYQAEVARAQRGSGFIAADVGPGGNVITPGYDPERDPMAIKARQEATNLQRNQYMASLMQGGATAAEALRAANGRYPSTVDPALLMKAEALALKQNPSVFQPRVINLDGVRVLQTGPNSAQRLQEPKIQGGTVSPAARAKDDILKDQITALRKKLTADVLPPAPEEAAAIEAQIAQKERERVALFETPETNPNIDQPSWLAMRDRFNAPQRPEQEPAEAPKKKVNEVVRMVKGRRAVYDADTKEFIRFE